jgi:hypothetical protein
MAISSKVNVGTGAQFFVRNGTRTDRGSHIRDSRRENWQSENIPPVRVTFPDGTHILSDQDDIDHNLSNVLRQDVRLMKASLEKPIYEEYWPDIDGLAQREKVTDEAMPSQTFFLKKTDKGQTAQQDVK